MPWNTFGARPPDASFPREKVEVFYGVTTFESNVEIRAAVPGDLPSLAAFIARMNAKPASQSLYCAADSTAGVRSALRNAEDCPGGWEHSFAVGVQTDGEIVAALGCQFDPERTFGWLWGPWVNRMPGDWTACAPDMFDRLLKQLPPTVRRLEAFLHAENASARRFLQARGFTTGILTHIYVRPRVGWNGSDEAAPGGHTLLRPAHEVAFARLHVETFPAGASTPADDLLAGRDDEHAIFAATDGLRLLGYVCVSVNRAPREGFIEYLAVKPAARGRGIGARLLQTALRWTFEDRRLPQAALCVSEWRGGARRLYEQAGFTLHASGVAARWRVQLP